MHPFVWLLIGAVLSPLILTVGNILVYLVGLATIVGVVIFVLNHISEN